MSHSAVSISVEQAQHPLFVGVDVGGTNIKIGVVDDLGRILTFDKTATCEERGPEDAIARVRQRVDDLLSEIGLARSDLRAAGLGTPGTMDIPGGLILEPPNLPAWRHFPIRDRLSEALQLPVAFANDGGAAAYGEFWLGSGKAFHSIVMLTLGTGVGGGIIIGDMSLDGENSHGSECGHIIIDGNDDARVCSCGQRGHLEAYASATALVRRTEEALAARDAASSLRPRIAGGEPLSSLMVAQEAERGDALSRHLVMQTARYLGIGIVSLMHTIDPGAVILGGAMDFGGHQSPLGREFLEQVRQTVRSRTFPVLAQRTVVDFASLGGDAGYLGAAGIARVATLKASGNN